MAKANFWRTLGPGLLFSGAAVGVSHLVQSTRAGALFGLALVATIVVINILKYPAYRFGVDYGQSTRQSLLAGYRELGLWAPILFCLVIVPVAPIIVAAISATTAGLLGALTGIDLALPALIAIVLGSTVFLIIVGGYHWLDRVNRLLMLFLILATLATTVMVLPGVEWRTLADTSWIADPAALLFVIALAGFMPNPLDVSVPQSIWTVEAEENVPPEQRATLAEARKGFLGGYLVSGILALCFCIMGAGVMHTGNVEPASDAVGFAAQLVGLYRETLGPVPALLAAISALAVMLSTMFVAFDAYGKSFTAAFREIGNDNDPLTLRRAYIIIVLSVAALAFAAVLFLLTDFGTFVDLATSLAFLSAPIIALLNHLVVTRCAMPDSARPSAAIRGLNILAIAVMGALAVSYFML
ncbi:NRAMP family divalent metal transporter [Pontixanthobacter aquaemixtae]|uniref:Divalent metal cation transporter n=1 Tax=Pontixanthobacter aquaemixtae TaxID=1958940 RepID=A0A845A2V3_9SPHN|nr:divalent metal cation transporter [Pontixanthobacter aquaemixtae]MXO91949.1 divalent metal cation transporter [Pontixanthobacter aquaemixtae]